MEHIAFNEFSHVTFKYRTENNTIKRIKKGEHYCQHPFLEAIIEEDYDSKFGLVRYFNNWQSTAKEDRWYSGNAYFKTIEEVVKDWNDHVIYKEEEDKWYIRPWLELTLNDGTKRKTFFNSDEELENELALYGKQKFCIHVNE